MSIIKQPLLFIGSKGEKTLKALYNSGLDYSCINKNVVNGLGEPELLPEPFWMETMFESRIVKWLSDTGKMTLTNYVQHLTIGMLILQALTGRKYTGFLQMEMPVSPTYIFNFSIVYFIISIIFSTLWTKKFKKGPLEIFMRKISG